MHNRSDDLIIQELQRQNEEHQKKNERLELLINKLLEDKQKKDDKLNEQQKKNEEYDCLLHELLEDKQKRDEERQKEKEAQQKRDAERQKEREAWNKLKEKYAAALHLDGETYENAIRQAKKEFLAEVKGYEERVITWQEETKVEILSLQE